MAFRWSSLDLGLTVERVADPRTVVLLCIIALAFIIVGRRLQRAFDLYHRWRTAVANLAAAIAALPGIRGDFWRGVGVLLKVGVVAVILFWAAVHIDLLTE